MANKALFWYNYKRFVDEGTIKPLSPKTFVVSGLITICGLVLSIIIYCLAFPDNFIGEHTPVKLFFCTLLYMLGTLAMIGGVYFGISLVVTRFIPTQINMLVLRCFMYVVQIVLFLLIFIGGFENYFSVYGISSYSDDIKAIKSDFVMMAHSAKDMFSDTETIKDVRFDANSYLYTDGKGQNAMYIYAIDDNDYKTKFMISPSDKSQIDFTKYYDVTYYPNVMTITSLNVVGEYDAAEKARKKEQDETTELLNKLLDMDLEITLEVSEKGTVFIKRPYIAKYSNHDSFPPEREISLYIKKDGEFYENWGFTQKDWLNNFTSRLEKMRNDKITEPIKFEFTLVFGYDEVTGEYTPISNTIVYIVDKECIYDPHPEYESIPLNKQEVQNTGNE